MSERYNRAAEIARAGITERFVDAVSYANRIAELEAELERLRLSCKGVDAASTDAIPQDVVDLVIAARIVAFEDQGPEAIKALDTASEAFASRVPWHDEPEETDANG